MLKIYLIGTALLTQKIIILIFRDCHAVWQGFYFPIFKCTHKGCSGEPQRR